MVTVHDSGTDDDGSDYEWSGNSGCVCCECNHGGTVDTFTESGQVGRWVIVVLNGYELQEVIGGFSGPQDCEEYEEKFLNGRTCYFEEVMPRLDQKGE